MDAVATVATVKFRGGGGYPAVVTATLTVLANILVVLKELLAYMFPWTYRFVEPGLVPIPRLLVTTRLLAFVKNAFRFIAIPAVNRSVGTVKRLAEIMVTVNALLAFKFPVTTGFQEILDTFIVPTLAPKEKVGPKGADGVPIIAPEVRVVTFDV